MTTACGSCSSFGENIVSSSCDWPDPFQDGWKSDSVGGGADRSWFPCYRQSLALETQKNTQVDVCRQVDD